MRDHLTPTMQCDLPGAGYLSKKLRYVSQIIILKLGDMRLLVSHLDSTNSGVISTKFGQIVER